jgi:hypothetical protein
MFDSKLQMNILDIMPNPEAVLNAQAPHESDPQRYRRQTANSIANAQEMLLTEGYTIVTDRHEEDYDEDFGFDGIRKHMLDIYFGENGILKPETYDVFPHNRYRARGVVAFQYSEDGREVYLEDYDDGAISGKAYHEDERSYDVTPLMHDPYSKRYLTNLLTLIPRPVEINARNGAWYSQHLVADALKDIAAPNAIVASRYNKPSDGKISRVGGSRLLEVASYQADKAIQEYLRLTRAGSRGIIGVNFLKFTMMWYEASITMMYSSS